MGRRPNLAHTILQARRETFPTQLEAAAKIGIGRNTLWSYERGHTVPGPPHLLAIATAYGLDLEPLTKMAEQANRPRAENDRRRRVERLTGEGATVLSVLLCVVTL